MSVLPFNNNIGVVTLLTWASFTITVLSQCDPSKFCSNGESCEVFQSQFHCFYVYNQTRMWTEADVLCRSRGAQLAEIYDVTTFDLFKTVNKYMWLNAKPSDLSQWTYLRSRQSVAVDSSTLDSWQTHCGVLVQESSTNPDGNRNNRIWLTTRRCSERMNFICRKNAECSITGDNCIKVIKEEMSWYEAREHCTKTGGDLMWINSGESLDKINPLLQSNGAAMYFVGFTKRHWKWQSSDSDIAFSRWWYQDPDEAVAPSVCLHTYPSGFWGDVSCDMYMHPVCMKERTDRITPTFETDSSSDSTIVRTTPTSLGTTRPLFWGFKDQSTSPSSTSTTTTTTTTATTITSTNSPKTPTTTESPTTPSTPDSTFTSTTISPSTTFPTTSTTAFTPTTALTLSSTSHDKQSTQSNEKNSSPPVANTQAPKQTIVTSPMEDNGSHSNVTVSAGGVESAASKSPVLSYGVIAGLVVGITVSATCLVAAVAVVIHSRNKARRRLIQNLPTYSGDTCRSFVFDNVTDPPAPAGNPNQLQKQENVSKKPIPLHYQNVSLTTDSTDSGRALTSQEKFKERRKHTYVNLFRPKNKFPNKEQCNC